MAKQPLSKNLIGFLASVAVAVLAPLFGLGVTMLSLAIAFRRNAAVDPADKARALAEGISGSMNGTAAGIVVAGLALLPMTVFAVRLYRESKRRDPR